MIDKLADNRVYRSYLGGSRIDEFLTGLPGKDGSYPEDWLASTVEAFNPGHEIPGEGLGRTVDGRLIRDLVPNGLPILVKLLDAAQRLVIQVHPTRAFARERWHSPVGKTESWYILKASPEACVYIGFQPEITRRAWEECFQTQNISRMLGFLHRFSVKPGDCIFVPGGVPHAIGGGCLMIETQEPSDLMVIPERTTPSGIALADSKLHGGLGFEGMMDCFSFEGATREEAHHRFFMQPKRLDDSCSCLLNGRENGLFSVIRLSVCGNYTRSFSQAMGIAVVLCGHGTLELNGQTVEVSSADRLLLRDLNQGDLHIHSEPLDIVLALPD